jgi:hypothetical protein
MMGQGGVGPVITGSGFIGAGELGRTALLRGSIATLAARGLLGDMSGEDIEAMSDAELQDLIDAEDRRPGGGPGGGAGAGAGGAGGMYQDLFEQIEEYKAAASVPSKSELIRYKLDEDRAKGLKNRRTGIEALMPTAEEYALRGRGVSFGALSKVLARTGDPRKRQDFGQIGEAISGETDRQLDQRLGFEDIFAGIDTDIYGVEGQGLDRRGLRERAGEAFIPIELGARQSQLEARQARELEILRQSGGQEAMFSIKNLPTLVKIMQDYEMPEEVRNQIMTRISSMFSNASSEEQQEIQRIMAGRV